MQWKALTSKTGGWESVGRLILLPAWFRKLTMGEMGGVDYCPELTMVPARLYKS